MWAAWESGVSVIPHSAFFIEAASFSRLLPAAIDRIGSRTAPDRYVMASLVRFCLILVWLASAATASAQQLAGCETSKQWQIDRLSKDHAKLIGQVEVTCQNETFFADEIEIFSDQDRLIARGNVVFTSGESRIAADRAEFNTKTKTGTFFNAAGSAAMNRSPAREAVPSAALGPANPTLFGGTEPDVYFYGETLQKIGDKKYKITKGGFTTCLQPKPRWELTSGSVTVNLDQYAIATNSLFKVKGIPVLYLPVFYYPVQEDDRATGFLIPTYGSSTIRGQSISNAFFWAISRSQDATFMHDWYSRTGQGFGTEYRYVRGRGSDGSIRLYNLREHGASYPGTGGETVATPERESYEIRGTMSQMLTPRWRARGRADYFSSLEVQQTYNQNIYEASRRQRVFSGSVTGAWREYNIVGTFDRSEYFYGTTSSSVRGGTPRLMVNRNERPLFGSRLFYLSVNGEYNRLLIQRKAEAQGVDQSLTRYDFMPRLRVPFTRWQWLTVNSTAAFRTTYWTESKDSQGAQVEEGLTRNYYDLSSEVTGPVFNRIWTRQGSSYAEKLKHSVQPYFNIQRISAIDVFSQIVQLDSVDTVVGSTTRIGYGVANRFYRKPGGNGRSREIATVSLGQTYYTDARAAQFDKYYRTSFNGTPPSKFSPLSLQVRSTPTDTVVANFRAEYDTQFNAFRTMAADGTMSLGSWLQATAGWSQRRYIPDLPGFNDKSRLDHYLNALTNVRTPSNRFGGLYQFNYDVLHGSFLQQRMVAYYNAQCCGFAVEYQAYDMSRLGYSPVQQDNRFNFSFTLAGIGTLANFFGALGGAPGR
jgi:LPS-assembly protein